MLLLRVVSVLSGYQHHKSNRLSHHKESFTLLVHVQHVRPYSAEAIAVGPTLLILLLFFSFFLVFAVFGLGFFLTGYEDGPQSKVIV